MAKLHTKYQFLPDRNEWMGVVYTQGLFRKKVITLGIMSTEAGIKLWLAAYLRTGVEPSDLYSEI